MNTIKYPKLDKDTSNFTVINFDRRIHYNMFDKSYQKCSISSSEINFLQDLLAKAVIEHNELMKTDSTVIWSNVNIDLTQYKRQFFPAKNREGEKVVFVNCICIADIPGLYQSKIDWKKDTFKTNDGGKCYFHLYINLTTSQHYYFVINGYTSRKQRTSWVADARLLHYRANINR